MSYTNNLGNSSFRFSVKKYEELVDVCVVIGVSIVEGNSISCK
jgi:hypothetical protein